MARMKPKFTLRDLFWLVLVVAMGLWLWAERSNSSDKLRWATHRADSNEKALLEACKSFEREDYLCDLSFVRNDHGVFYTGMNVVRPTDSSFYVEFAKPSEFED